MNPQTVINHLQNGLKFHQSGQLDEAIRIYEEILRMNPGNADALHLCGLAFNKQNNHQKGLKYLKRAVTIQPTSANYLNSLGTAYQSAGQLKKAIDAFQNSIRLKPDSVQAYLNLGDALKRTDQITQAIDVYRKAFQLNPAMTDTRYNLANILRDSGNENEAIDLYLSLLAGYPDLTGILKEGLIYSNHQSRQEKPLHVRALNNLSVLLVNQKRYPEVISLLKQGISYVPEHVSLHINMGIAYAKQNLWETALDCFLNAIELEPGNSNAYFNAGHAHQNLGNYSEALSYYQKAIQYNPSHHESYNNSGMIYLEVKEFDSAKNAFEKALEISADTDEIRSNLGCLAIKTGHLDEAKEHFEYLTTKNSDDLLLKLRLVSLCPELINSNTEIESFRGNLSEQINQINTDQTEIPIESLPEVVSPPPYNLQFHGKNDRKIKEQYAHIYRTIIQKKYRSSTVQKSDQGKPRIGFVITAGHEGPFERFIGGVLEQLNYDSFDPIIFCDASTINNLKQKMQCNDLEYIPLPRNLEHAVECISQQHLKLLYHWEVGSDPLNYLLPFFQAAQKQVVSMGLPVTTGIREIDYFLTSKLVEPEDHQTHYTEKVLMGETLLSWQKRREWNQHDNILEELGIPCSSHLYLCGHKIQKFHPDFDSIMGRILEQDPEGLLLIPGDKTGLFTPKLLDRLEKQFPKVSKRIHILPQLDYDRYLSLVNKANVLLDPLHYGGGLSSYDGFSLNKVIVTLPGEYHRGRYTQAFYHKMGLEEFISKSADDYIKMAVAIGSDEEYRIEQEQKIEAASPLLFENREVVNEYQQIFEKLIHE